VYIGRAQIVVARRVTVLAAAWVVPMLMVVIVVSALRLIRVIMGVDMLMIVPEKPGAEKVDAEAEKTRSESPG